MALALVLTLLAGNLFQLSLSSSSADSSAAVLLEAYKSRFLPSPQQHPPTYAHGNFVGGVGLRCHLRPSFPSPASSAQADDSSHYPPGAAVAVGIVSALGNRARRDALRRTWLTLPSIAVPSLPSGSFEYAFFLGLDSSRQIPPHVVQEMNEFHDIVVVDIVDTYKNMIYKVVALETWGSRACGASYVLRSNDDVYLNLSVLFRSLLQQVPAGIYGGYFLSDVLVLRPDGGGDAAAAAAEVAPEKSSAVPVSVYPSDVYPVFAQGNAYVLSRDMAEVVVGLSEEPWRRLFADDILVGLLMDGRRARMVMIQADFAPDGGRNECREGSVFQFDIGVEAMDRMYFNDVNGRPHCEGVEVLV